jgi:hypothetical protein
MSIYQSTIILAKSIVISNVVATLFIVILWNVGGLLNELFIMKSTIRIVV